MANDVFDEHFRNRLMAFQRDHGLTLDGTLGPQAWTKLAEVANSKPEPTPGTTPTKPSARTSFTITAEEFPLLVKLATLCVDEAGVAQFIREELDVDVDGINATIEEVLA